MNPLASGSWVSVLVVVVGGWGWGGDEGGKIQLTLCQKSHNPLQLKKGGVEVQHSSRNQLRRDYWQGDSEDDGEKLNALCLQV